MSEELNESQLELLSQCGLVFPEMTTEQKIATLVQSIKSRSETIQELSREYQERHSHEPLTLTEYMVELNLELKKVNSAASALDDFVRNPANW